MRVARKMRLVRERSKFVTGEFFIDLRDLRREDIIRACRAIADKAGDLRIGFQGRPDHFNLSFSLVGRNVGHNGAYLFAERLKERLLVV